MQRGREAERQRASETVRQRDRKTDRETRSRRRDITSLDPVCLGHICLDPVCLDPACLKSGARTSFVGLPGIETSDKGQTAEDLPANPKWVSEAVERQWQPGPNLMQARVQVQVQTPCKSV